MDSAAADDPETTAASHSADDADPDAAFMHHSDHHDDHHHHQDQLLLLDVPPVELDALSFDGDDNDEPAAVQLMIGAVVPHMSGPAATTLGGSSDSLNSSNFVTSNGLLQGHSGTAVDAPSEADADADAASASASASASAARETQPTAAWENKDVSASIAVPASATTSSSKSSDATSLNNSGAPQANVLVPEPAPAASTTTFVSIASELTPSGADSLEQTDADEALADGIRNPPNSTARPSSHDVRTAASQEPTPLADGSAPALARSPTLLDCVHTSPKLLQTFHSYSKEAAATGHYASMLIGEGNRLHKAVELSSKAMHNVAQQLGAFPKLSAESLIHSPAPPARQTAIPSPQAPYDVQIAGSGVATERDLSFESAMAKFSNIMHEIHSWQELHQGQLSSVLMQPLQRLMQDQLKSVKVASAKLEEAAAEHESACQRYARMSKRKETEKARFEANAELYAARKKFHVASLEYYVAMRRFQHERKAALLEPMLAFMHAQASYFQMGANYFQNQVRPFLQTLNTELAESREFATKDLQRLPGLVEHIEQEYAAKYNPDADPDDPFADYLPANLSLITKTGYLMLRTNKIGKNGRRWDRVWFDVVDHQLVFSDDNNVVHVATHLHNATATVHDLDDRRFAFSVTSPAIAKHPLVLQAENERDRDEWMAVIKNVAEAAEFDTLAEKVPTGDLIAVDGDEVEDSPSVSRQPSSVDLLEGVNDTEATTGSSAATPSPAPSKPRTNWLLSRLESSPSIFTSKPASATAPSTATSSPSAPSTPMFFASDSAPDLTAAEISPAKQAPPPQEPQPPQPPASPLATALAVLEALPSPAPAHIPVLDESGEMQFVIEKRTFDVIYWGCADIVPPEAPATVEGPRSHLDAVKLLVPRAITSLFSKIKSRRATVVIGARQFEVFEQGTLILSADLHKVSLVGVDPGYKKQFFVNVLQSAPLHYMTLVFEPDNLTILNTMMQIFTSYFAIAYRLRTQPGGHSTGGRGRASQSGLVPDMSSGRPASSSQQPPSTLRAGAPQPAIGQRSGTSGAFTPVRPAASASSSELPTPAVAGDGLASAPAP